MTTYNSYQGTLGINDTQIVGNLPTQNFASDNFISVGYSSGTQVSLLKFNFTQGTNIPSPTISLNSGTVTVYIDTYSQSGTLVLYQCLRPWVETSATYNKYDSSNNWTTAGAASDGNDYSSTNLGSVAISSTGSKNIPLSSSGISLVQNWINGVTNNYGFVCRLNVENNSYDRISSSNCGTIAQIPKITLDYTPSYDNGYTLILNTT